MIILPSFSSVKITPEAQGLLERLEWAHYKSSFRENCSTVALSNSFLGSKSYRQAIASAILSLGDRHGPIENIMDFLKNGDVLNFIENKKTIPGWGNSFIKGKEDEFWLDVNTHLCNFYPEEFKVMNNITQALHNSGKMIFPNPGCYTALTAIILGIPSKVAEYLFLSCRLPAWTEIISQLDD